MPQFAPVNYIAGCQRMVFGKGDDDTFALHQ
ncbi:hypothetical protein ACVW1A_000240 [Bradyrhizobium sp. LB1.3]